MQRLQTREQFQAVLAGKTVARTRHFALHCTGLPLFEAQAQAEVQTQAIATSTATATATPSARQSPNLFARHDHWVGAMTPKRSAKRAVTRNAIKRQIYNVSSDLILQIPPAAYVVRLAAGFDKGRFTSASSPALKAAVREELLQLFAKAGLLPARRSEPSERSEGSPAVQPLLPATALNPC